MLRYIRFIKENPYKLGFVDDHSPKEWESLINDRLLDYKERAHVDSTIKMDNILVILELNPSHKSFNLDYIKREKKQFEDYYKRILRDIKF